MLAGEPRGHGGGVRRSADEEGAGGERQLRGLPDEQGPSHEDRLYDHCEQCVQESQGERDRAARKTRVLSLRSSGYRDRGGHADFDSGRKEEGDEQAERNVGA